jgi:hypothetical protein
MIATGELQLVLRNTLADLRDPGRAYDLLRR